ncbi:MAG: beta strand repeat-containing protein [Roseovarius sp.]
MTPDGKFDLDEVKASRTFTYTVTDGAGVTSTATVRVTINGQDDDPLAVADSATVSEDGPAQTINLTDNDTDADENDVLSIASVDTTDTQGSVTINEDGVSVDYDPNGAFESLAEGDMALDTFTYEVTDGDGLTSTETVTVTITGVNDDPNAVADSGEADEDGPSVTINLVANDTDVDTGDVLSIASLDLTGTLGAVTIDAGNESVTYDATGAFESLSEGETAEDTFSYTVTDSNGGTATQTVTVTITGRNDAPVVTAITEGPVSEDDGVQVIDLLDGQTDIDANDTLSVQNITVSDDTMAMVAFTDNGDGTIGIDADQYDSLNVGESRTVTVNYEVFDGTVAVANTATLVIEGRNDAPVVDAEMSDLAVSGDEDTTITGTVVATDPDATGTLSYSVAGMDGPANGSVLIDAVSGEYAYTPDDDFNGSDSFTVTITDDQNVSVTQVINVTVDPVNDASEIDVGAQVTAEHTEAVDALAPVPTLVAGDVTVSDVDGLDYDGGVFTASVVTGDLTDLLDLNQGGIVSISGTDVSVDGTVIGTISGQGSSTLSVTFNSSALAADVQAVISELTYATTDDTPVASRDITLDLSDGDGASAVQQTVSVDITASNDSPLANDDAFGVNEGAFSSTVNVLTRAPADSDPDGDTLSVTQISDLQDGDAASGGSAAVGASAGVITTDLGAEVTLQDDGQLFYNLSGTGAFNALAAGETAVDSFTYTVSDGNGGTDTATVSVTITGVNDAIVAKNDSIVTTEDDADTETGNILDNDVDVDTNDTRSIVNVFNSATATAIATAGGFQITTVDGIVIQLASDGSYTMTAPDDLASGEVATASFLYTVQDGGSAQSTATVTVEVTGNNDAPVVDAGNSDLAASGDEDTAITGTILATDADAGAVLTYSVEEGDGTANGSVSIDAVTGEYTYTPDADFNGSDSFTVTITDDQNVSVTQVVSLTVGPVNDAPEVDGPVDLGSSDEDVSLVITEAQLLATASDVDGDDLSVSGVTVSAGTVVDNMDGTWTFTPAADDDTEVTFTFAVSDGTDSTAAMATLDLLPVNDPAVVGGDISGSVTENANTPFNGVLTVTDVDGDDTSFVVSSVSTTYGAFMLDAGGAWSYTLDEGANAVERLVDGQVITETFEVFTQGGVQQQVTVTINGTTDLATPGNDTLVGTGGADFIEGLAGDDDLNGLGGDDTLDGGDGNDTLNGSVGADSLIGGSGNDNIDGADGDDFIDGGDGNDVLFGGDGDDELVGGDGDDRIRGDAGNDTLSGGAGSDDLRTGGGNSVADGGLDNDTVIGGTGMDTLRGGDGDDLIKSASGNDSINGDGGDDIIRAGADNDIAHGDDGNDLILGQGGDDELMGGAGQDRLLGGSGNDTLDGGSGDDTLSGGGGNDELDGGEGDDRLYGDVGDDILFNSAGQDRFEGGSGADTFVFDDHTVMGTGAAGRDLIFDFEDGIDVIDVSQMDADPSTAGIVDTFTFVGASGFTGTAGEIQISSVGSHTALDFDFDGDAVADGTILLRDFTGTITEDDFLF